MDWLLTNPQMQSTFSSLGGMQGDTYIVSPNAMSVLKEINCKLSCEDPTLRTFRRAVGIGQNIKMDLVPILINAKDTNVVEETIRILVNLTVPVECLLQVDDLSRTDFGNYTIFELSKLLIMSKEVFTDPKTTKAIVDYMKCILESDTKLSDSQCDNINNCLLLFRNILHIPEHNASILGEGYHSNSNCSSMQNIIVWNLFTQSIDKLLIHLMSSPQRSHWGVTMVQLIALIYKDQHVSTLQKLLNIWVESSLSDSSEDNESNTSPPTQSSEDSSSMLTSDPTSDSSDNGGRRNTISAEDRRQIALNKETESTLQQVSRKGHEYKNSVLRGIPAKQQTMTHQSHKTNHGSHQNHQSHHAMAPPKYPIHVGPNQKDVHMKTQYEESQMPESSPLRSEVSKSPLSPLGQISCGKYCTQKRDSLSDHSDCGYGTQVENQESISTSSNEDDSPHQKPKPPCNQKPRYNSGSKQRTITVQDKKEWRRKKLVKRSKSNLINIKGLVQHTPTDEDISNVLKEFTVDFLLKGYGYLVQDLHAQLLSDLKVQIDTSHFFWLVTYFLKFAAQLELDLEHISPVLSFEIISYLTFEGVTLCEQLDISSRHEGNEFKPYLRRIHLVVTAIRELLQALETYKKITHLSPEDRQHLRQLQMQICATEDLRCLFILLLRRYNQAIYSKQYLQDLIVTNHILLLLLDGTSKCPNMKVTVNIMDHIEQFASVEIMHHYGLLLDDFSDNGGFVNDCIFTMMHHIGGDLEKVGLLFQPHILKTFSKIWETEYEICDDWSDLIEYVIHKFMKTQQKGPITIPLPMQALSSPSFTELTKEHNMEHPVCTWTQKEKDSLQWYYAQSKKSKDVIGKILQQFSENGIVKKSRISIIHQLLEQDIITVVQYDDLMRIEDCNSEKTIVNVSTSSTSTGESGIIVKDQDSVSVFDEIEILKERILNENKGMMLFWLQKVLMQCCYVKLYINKEKPSMADQTEDDSIQVMESVAYHCILKNKSVPIVPWNSEQGAMMLHQPFNLLLHKLGFHLPQDVQMVFARIPNFWTADILYQTAQKLGPIDKSIIKFDSSLLNCADDIMLDSCKSPERSSNDTFAYPRLHHSNSVIRFTPDPASTPSVPNWLQLVMRSKCMPSDRMEYDPISTRTSFIVPSPPTTVLNKPSKRHQSSMLSDDDSIMKLIDGNPEDLSRLKRRTSNISSEDSGVNTNYDNEMLHCETASVASDLTRMYVSDEEDN